MKPHVSEYSCYSDLAAGEEEGVDYEVRWIEADCDVLIMAPHGGGIEPGTSEIARAVAHPECSYYGFEGLKPSGNSVLHITSARFDEPIARRIVTAHSLIVTFHGCTGRMPTVFMGGLHVDLMETMSRGLHEEGFETGVREDLMGNHAGNLCNRGTSGSGVQLELTWGLRRLMFRDLTRAGRHEPTRVFEDFVAVLKSAIADRRPLSHS